MAEGLHKVWVDILWLLIDSFMYNAILGSDIETW